MGELGLFRLIEEIISFLETDFEQSIVFIIFKSIFLFLSFLLSVGIIIVYLKAKKFEFKLDSLKKEKLTSIKDLSGNINKIVIRKKWQEVLKKFQTGTKEGLVLAIIEADSLFDFILKEIGLSGADMGERLKLIKKEQLSCLDKIWQVHKIRNRLAHESGFSLSREETSQALKIYQRALKELNVI